MVSINPALRNLFNRIFKKETTSTNVKNNTSYEDVGIFNAYLAERNRALYGYTQEVPVSDKEPVTEGEQTVKYRKSNFENPETIVNVPREYDETEPEEIIEETVQIEEEPEVEEEVKVDKTADIHITKNVNGKDVDFTYNIAKIENYAIENSYQSHFKDIPAIREKAPEDRTEAETKLLEEFDNMIKYIVDTGVEYGVDPDSIAAIIRKEVGFDGMSDRAVSSAGKGYMQLTTIAIEDMFQHPQKYGPEVEELMASRGFNINCPKSQQPAMAKKVMNYLKKNKDPEFNIRLGTIKLRRLLNTHNGNIEKAAYNYNGNKNISSKTGNQVRFDYSKLVKKYYGELSGPKP